MGYETAKEIIEARTQCASGKYDMYKSLSDRFSNRKGKKVDQLFKKVEDKDQDTDWETDDSGDDDDDEGGADVPWTMRLRWPRRRKKASAGNRRGWVHKGYKKEVD